MSLFAENQKPINGIMGMKYLIFFIALMAVINISCGLLNTLDSRTDNTHQLFKGDFEDDYGSQYSINDVRWIQDSIFYSIEEHNPTEEYFVIQQIQPDPETKIFIRVDYMLFDDMEPYLWGYCYTIYDTTSHQEAISAASADRSNPRKGCNGFPFSRMKRRK